VWESYENEDGTLHLTKLTVYNKTDRMIGSVKGNFVIINSDSSRINSGEFIINEPKGLSNYGERYFGDDQIINPNRKMEFDSYHMHFSNSPDIKLNQILILTIGSFDKIIDLDGE